MYLLEVDGVTEGVSECLSIKTGLLYLTKLKLVPTTFDSSSTPVADERSPALSAEPLVVVVILWVGKWGIRISPMVSSKVWLVR